MPAPEAPAVPTDAKMHASTSKTTSSRSNWLLIATGLAFTLIGWIDLTLVWLPLNPRSPEWEFGATSGFIDAMPLGTIGLVALCYATNVGVHVKAARILSMVFWLIAVLLIAVAIVFVSGLPLALNAVQDPAMKEILMLSIVKTLLFAGVYVSLYVATARWSWRSASRLKLAAGTR